MLRLLTPMFLCKTLVPMGNKQQMETTCHCKPFFARVRMQSSRHGELASIQGCDKNFHDRCCVTTSFAYGLRDTTLTSELMFCPEHHNELIAKILSNRSSSST